VVFVVFKKSHPPQDAPKASRVECCSAVLCNSGRRPLAGSAHLLASCRAGFEPSNNHTIDHDGDELRKKQVIPLHERHEAIGIALLSFFCDERFAVHIVAARPSHTTISSTTIAT
jgi:hypothetical protein